jgi:septal ring factor EnvC (AmiA/AmiB activator)
MHHISLLLIAGLASASFMMAGLSGCSDEERANAVAYSSAFVNGETVTPDLSQSVMKKAEELNASIIAVDAKLKAAQAQQNAKSQEEIDRLEAERQALLQKRTDLVDALESRQNALRQQGQALEQQYQTLLNTLKSTGNALYMPSES